MKILKVCVAEGGWRQIDSLSDAATPAKLEFEISLTVLSGLIQGGHLPVEYLRSVNRASQGLLRELVVSAPGQPAGITVNNNDLHLDF